MLPVHFLNVFYVWTLLVTNAPTITLRVISFYVFLAFFISLGYVSMNTVELCEQNTLDWFPLCRVWTMYQQHLL